MITLLFFAIAGVLLLHLLVGIIAYRFSVWILTPLLQAIKESNTDDPVGLFIKRAVILLLPAGVIGFLLVPFPGADVIIVLAYVFAFVKAVR